MQANHWGTGLASSAEQRLTYIDGLRLIGAGAVVAQHLLERIDAPWAKAFNALAPGVFGVVLFFLISGFVIPFSVKPGFDVRGFAIRRVARIYPVFLVVILLALLEGLSGISPHFRMIASASLGDWLANLLLVQDFTRAKAFYSVSWTLAIEFIWYALFVMMMKLAQNRAGIVSALVAPAVMLLLTLASLAIGTRIPLGRPGMIYAAVLGYQTYRHQRGELGARGWWLNVALFLVVTLASNFVAFGIFRHPNITMMQAIGPWTAAMALFVATVTLPWLRAALAQRWIVAIGAASYSIYMIHPLAIAAAVHLKFAVLVIPATLLLTLVMAVLSYRFIELPGIRLGRALAARRPADPRLATAVI